MKIDPVISFLKGTQNKKTKLATFRLSPGRRVDCQQYQPSRQHFITSDKIGQAAKKIG